MYIISNACTLFPNSIIIDDKMISDKKKKNCNKSGGIDWGYMIITRVEGIEHGCASVEQQALLGVGNEVREKDQCKWGAKEENNKGQLDKGGEQKVMGMLPAK